MSKTRGPGTIEERIEALRNKLTSDQISSAEVVADNNDDDVLKLAGYLKSLVRRETARLAEIKKHESAIATLNNGDE